MNYFDFLKEWQDPDIDCIRVKTSGSTGVPKIISLTKEFVKQSAVRTNKFFDIDKDSLLYSCISPDFIGGKMMMVRALLAGCKFKWETPTNNSLINYKDKEPISLLSVVPSQVISLLERIEDLPVIENIIIGGSSIHPELVKRIVNSGLNFYESYGMTETASHIALRKVGAGKFKPMKGIGIDISKKGTLIIKFDSGEKIITNDLAEKFSDGSFRIKGRIDNIIISGGKKFSPEEIEFKIAPFIHSNFYIKGEPDEKWGEKIVLVIEESSAIKKNDDELFKLLREKLSSEETPKLIKRVKTIGKTTTGKIKRK